MIVKYKNQLTLAYWSGYLTAILYNRYGRRSNLPSVVLCMRDFTNLRMLFGKYYSLLKNNENSNEIVLIYEKLNNKLDLPFEKLGEYTDFMLGFSNKIKKEKLNKNDFIFKEEMNIGDEVI